MAKGKPGVVSKETKKLLEEQKETDNAQAVREEEMVKAEADAKKLVEEPKPEKVDEKARKARYADLLEAYAEQNPVKYAAKKAAGDFDDIPADFN